MDNKIIFKEAIKAKQYRIAKEMINNQSIDIKKKKIHDSIEYYYYIVEINSPEIIEYILWKKIIEVDNETLRVFLKKSNNKNIKELIRIITLYSDEIDHNIIYLSGYNYEFLQIDYNQIFKTIITDIVSGNSDYSLLYKFLDNDIMYVERKIPDIAYSNVKLIDILSNSNYFTIDKVKPLNIINEYKNIQNMINMGLIDVYTAVEMLENSDRDYLIPYII